MHQNVAVSLRSVERFQLNPFSSSRYQKFFYKCSTPTKKAIREDIFFNKELSRIGQRATFEAIIMDMV